MKSRFVILKRVAVTFIIALLLIEGAAMVQTFARQVDDKSKKQDGDSPAAQPQSAEFIYPRIKGYGKVVHLPRAAAQPRNGSKICVDVTAKGPVGKVHPAIEKVARFVNIYAGAGKQSAEANITVILHGDATQVALSDAAFRRRFQTRGNPSAQLMRGLKDAGVEFVVCGQALHHKGFNRDEVSNDVNIAVSALTANVNRQMDGYAIVHLH